MILKDMKIGDVVISKPVKFEADKLSTTNKWKYMGINPKVGILGEWSKKIKNLEYNIQLRKDQIISVWVVKNGMLVSLGLTSKKVNSQEDAEKELQKMMKTSDSKLSALAKKYKGPK